MRAGDENRTGVWRGKCARCRSETHNRATCPLPPQPGERRDYACKACGENGHSFKSCWKLTTEALALEATLSRCPTCWDMRFASEAHVCGPRRRMAVPYRTREWVA